MKTVSKNYLINNINQWLYVNQCPNPRGAVVFLHGGPGWSDAPWAGLICQRLWGQVTTVHWDQRGSNRSSSERESRDATPPSVDQMVSDGLEVCRLIRDEFGIQQPLLIGHSWGAFLGVLMAARAPELFRGYIGIGQLVANHESEPLSLQFCRRRAEELGRNDLAEELRAMPDDFYRSVSRVFREREILSELGGEFYTPVAESQMIEWIERSPLDYRSDWATMMESCIRSCTALWPELIERSLFDEVKRLEVPIALVHGVQDYCTAPEPARRWLDRLSCAGDKEFVSFENSAHWPQIEENEKFAEIVLRRLK